MFGISRRPRFSIVPGGNGTPLALSQCTPARSGPSSLQVKTTSWSKGNESGLDMSQFRNELHATIHQ